MRALVVWVALAAAGCGRIGFSAEATRGDASHADAPPTGDAVPADVAAAGPCPGDALLCDDFESGTIGSAWSFELAPGASVDIGQTAAHGRYAIDAVVPPAGSDGEEGAISLSFPVRTTGVVATRAYVRSPDALVDFAGVLIMKNFPDYGLAACNASGNWVVSEQGMTSGLHDHVTQVPCPAADTWTCVELDYTLGATPSLQLYVDGAKLLDEATRDPSPSFTSSDIGAAHAPMAGLRVFADDVVIATSHIGC